MATAVAGGAMLLSANSANASTKIDDSHVQVVAGDTLSKIAEENNTTVDQLVKDNHIANKDLIHVGDKLVIVPGATNQTAQATVNTTASNNNQASQAQPSQPAQASATTNNSTASASLNGSEQAAKDWIAGRESGGSYSAMNGRYVGKFQLDSSYLNGDYSPANQERVADQYVQNRYSGWNGAKAHWEQFGWY